MTELRATDHRSRLLDGLPVTERRLDLAGVSTAVLEGGDGPPLVLLHGPAEYGAKWMDVLPELVRTHHVTVPDLPGHGTSTVDGELDAGRVLSWLGALVDATCDAPPAIVGHIVGGAVAARFAVARPDRLSHLVLVDSLGLAPFQPAPEFGRALTDYLAEPSEDTHDRFWRLCAYDLDRLQARMGERWTPFAAYNLEQVRAPGMPATTQALMGEFGVPPIPPEDLERISVPVSLIWGRHDLATALEVAEAAGARFGWPLQVIEGSADDPVVEQPEAFLRALHVALGRTVTRRPR